MPDRARGALAFSVALRIVLEGLLTVYRAAAFAETLAVGVGRPRAFCRGYIRMEPLAP
jgi:hypothetical protein